MIPEGKDLSVRIEQLEIEGINIARRSQESDAVYYDDLDHLDKVFVDYNLWLQRIKDFLIQEKITTENYFFLPDSVPKMKGGIYGHITNPKSQKLLKNIRLETSRRVEKLIELKRKQIKHEQNGVIINKDTKKPKQKTAIGGVINKMEFLKDPEKRTRIKVYINENYSNELGFNRGNYWNKLYDLAENQIMDYEKAFFDYFNSNSKNPLYAKYSFTLTKILKVEDKRIVPNIEINLITQKKVTQRSNSA